MSITTNNFQTISNTYIDLFQTVYFINKIKGDKERVLVQRDIESVPINERPITNLKPFTMQIDELDRLVRWERWSPIERPLFIINQNDQIK